MVAQRKPMFVGRHEIGEARLRVGRYIVALVFVVGCGQETYPVPAVEPFQDLPGDVRLGMRAADLFGRRPGIELSHRGQYVETLDRTELAYFFSPQELGFPVPPSARLTSVESRIEFFDSVSLTEQWRARVRAISRSESRPSCQLLGDARSSVRRATFGDTIAVSIDAELWRAPDGQGIEAYLVTRASLGSPFHESASIRRTEIDCSELTAPAR